MSNNELAKDWLRRALSNLARAESGKVSDNVLYEDLCYDAQQAVEKSLKSLCIFNSLDCPRTHDISYLFDIVQKSGVKIPENVELARALTEYAVETRYPGDYEPIDEEDYLAALDIAQNIISWVNSIII